jgi:hypothetical protein
MIDFDYIKYDPKNNKLIILDLESPTTYRKLNEVSLALINKLKQYLQIIHISIIKIDLLV